MAPRATEEDTRTGRPARLEAGLPATESQFVILTAAEAIVSADARGVITSFNPAAERLFGYSAAEALSEPLTILMPERFRAAHRTGLQRFRATRERHLIGSTVELVALRKDGREIPVELSLSTWEARGETNLTAFIRDITERKRIEHITVELAAIVEQSDESILRKTRDGVITEWNRAAERMYGYTADEMIGEPADVLIPEGRDGEEREILRRVLADQVVTEFETVRLRKHGGPIDVAVTVSPLRDTGGEIVGASAIARDITDRKRAERELRRSNEDLEQFAYVVSHDLSEPLRVIAGFVDLLARRYEGRLDEEADRFIGFTVAGVERMQALIDDILAYSRIGRTELRPTDVDTAELVDDVLQELVNAVAERGAHVDVGELPTVCGEPALLRQVFQNVIGNAVKFASGTPPRVRVSAIRQCEGWRFDVEDNGPGVAPRYAERIFEMFQRLHGRDVPGTGIGLSIAKRVVDRHGGRIWVEPAPVGGSLFRFTIPPPNGRAP